MSGIQIGLIDYLIIGIYFLFVIGIGFALKRFNKTSTDFFLSGRSIPAWIAGEIFLPHANAPKKQRIVYIDEGSKIRTRQRNRTSRSAIELLRNLLRFQKFLFVLRLYRVVLILFWRPQFGYVHDTGGHVRPWQDGAASERLSYSKKERVYQGISAV